MAVAIAVSLLLGIPLLVMTWRSTGFVLGLAYNLLAMLPAWSIIIAAVGAPVRRKVTYSLWLLAFVLAFHVVSYATGWQNAATDNLAVAGSSEALLVSSYRLTLVAAPVVALVFFIGKRPEMLWTKAS